MLSTLPHRQCLGNFHLMVRLLNLFTVFILVVEYIDNNGNNQEPLYLLTLSLYQCRDLSHQNICNFIGACLDSPQTVILTEYCPKGSLQVFTHLYLIHFCKY